MTRKQFLIPLIVSSAVSTFWGVSCFLDGKAWAAMIVPCLAGILVLRAMVRTYGSTAFIMAGARDWKVMVAMNIITFVLGIWSAWENIQWWEYMYCTAVCATVSVYMGQWASRQ